MKKYFLRSFLATLAFTHSALACSPDPGFVYDAMTDGDMAIATALVTTVELDTTDTSTCWQVGYSDVRYLRGQGADAFSVTTCMDEVFDDEALAEQAEGLEYMGLVPNAEVLVGVVRPGGDASETRYAVPSCWGPLHVNLGQMTGEERTGFVDGFKAQSGE